MSREIGVVIPTYRPDRMFFALLKQLAKQTVEVSQIILMHTNVTGEVPLAEQLKEQQIDDSKIRIYTHSKDEFDHGATRHKGIELLHTDYALCMTQDAIPKNEYMIEHLLEAVEQDKVAVAYGRQMVGENATPLEDITRQFNYGEESLYKTEADLERLGIKTFFCSNVCALYDRKLYLALGGFIRKTIFNEDMIYAAKAVRNGYAVCYVANAMVIHSHSYTNMQQLRRNFDLGVSQAMNPQVFHGISSQKEGIQLVRRTAKMLKERGYQNQVLPMYLTSGYKFIGYQLGKHYRVIPHCLRLRITMDQSYWKK